MARKTIPNITMENARIMFRNFSGAEGQYNRAGDRNFAVALDPELATKMIEDGWNVNQLKPREDGDAPQDYVKVTVKYSEKARPPRVTMITSAGRRNLDEPQIDILDWADIKNVDLIIRPYEWEVQGKTGVKAYLQSIYITLNEDELDLKYADVQETSAQNAVGTGGVQYQGFDQD